MDLKKKVKSSRALYLSHIEAVQNVVRLHKASSVAGLEEISSLASSNAQSIEEVGAAIYVLRLTPLRFSDYTCTCCVF